MLRRLRALGGSGWSVAKWTTRNSAIAALALAGILVHVSLRYVVGASPASANLPLLVVLAVGGVPLVAHLVWRGAHGAFGSDHLAGVSILASALVTSRAEAERRFALPPGAPTGLECVIVIDDRVAAILRFHDIPRTDNRGFVDHLKPKHGIDRVLLVSGDREAEVRRLADRVSIHRIHAQTSPEEKVAIVRRETERAKTIFVGDGINDAPALMAATVGVAFGQQSDVTSEAARVVIIDSSLSKVDELIHLSYRLRRVALQSAIGGMVLSGVGMVCAALGMLSPVAGAVAQEVIDLLAVINAARTSRPPATLTDFV